MRRMDTRTMLARRMLRQAEQMQAAAERLDLPRSEALRLAAAAADLVLFARERLARLEAAARPARSRL